MVTNMCGHREPGCVLEPGDRAGVAVLEREADKVLALRYRRDGLRMAGKGPGET